MPYPVYTAGQRLTAALLSAMQPIVVQMSADQSVTNSTTLTNVTELTFSMAASAKYELVVMIYATGSTTGDLQTNWVVPSGVLKWANSYFWTAQAYDGNAWSVNHLASVVSGDDPLQAIVDLVGEYWARTDEGQHLYGGAPYRAPECLRNEMCRSGPGCRACIR